MGTQAGPVPLPTAAGDPSSLAALGTHALELWQPWAHMHLSWKAAHNPQLLATSLRWTLEKANPESPLSKDLPSQPIARWQTVKSL